MKHSVLALALLLAASALAAEAPSQALEKTEQAIGAEQARAKELSAKAAEVQAALTELQKTLVPLAAEVQRAERRLSAAEEALRTLSAEQKEKSARLEKRRGELDAMVSAAIRLSRTPPEAAIMMPGEFEHTLKAARVISSLTRSIRTESEGLLKALKELRALTLRVQAEQAGVKREQAGLKERQAQLEVKLRERRALAKELGEAQAQAQARISELSKQAGDLRELVAGLEKERREKEVREQETRSKWNIFAQPRGEKGKLRSIARMKGELRPPAVGSILHRFGEALSRNATSKGITLNARGGAKVVAPYDGEVVFSGPFLEYGRMVILRHRDEMHTLLAGLSAIDVNAGEFLLEGEPIGAMGNSSRELYVEMREHNLPVDPARWIAFNKN